MYKKYKDMNIIINRPFKINRNNVLYVEKMLNQFINIKHNNLNIFVKLNHVKIFQL